MKEQQWIRFVLELSNQEYKGSLKWIKNTI